jgi:putative ABC transport system permease protein
MHDIRYAIRLLRGAPAHTITAIAALALGLGSTIAIFSAVYAILYRPLPLVDPSRLVVPVSTNLARGLDRASVPYADHVDWRAQAEVFEEVAVYRPVPLDLAGTGAPERVDGLQVSDGYFGALSAPALAGRLLSSGDYSPGAPPVMVISDRLWRRRFGGDPAVPGREVRLAGAVATVAGVIDSRRTWPPDKDVWLPLKPDRLNDDVRTRRDNMIFLGIARLRPGVSLAQGRARVAAIAARVAQEHPESRKGWSSNLIPLREDVVEPEMRLGLLVLLGGGALVLLIACVNLANLLLAKGADRAREVALRAALGASRARLVRQLMTESLMLAAAGGVVGLGLATWLVRALVASAPGALPFADAITIDAQIVAAAIALTAATAVVFGLAPALSASGIRSAQTLRSEGHGAGSRRQAGRIRDGLVVAEMALAIVLLAGAGLLLRSVSRLVHVNPGVDVERVLTGRVSLPGARYSASADRVRFFEQLAANLRAVPGVEGAAAASYVPAGGRGFGLGRVFLLDGQPAPPASSDYPANWNVVTPEFFTAMGMRVVRGRAFTDRDAAEATPVTMINETMARRVFGAADPLGRRMRSWRDENLLREIIGVVSDVRYNGLADDERSLVYVPHRQDAWGLMTVIVRAAGDPAALAEPLRREVARLDRDVAVASVAPLSTQAAASIATQRFAGLLLGLFAATAALLAGVGIYGVMTYAVARRRREMGVRLALGASPASLFALVVRRGAALTAVGIALGMGGAIAVGRLMQTLLFGISPADAATFVTVPLVLGAVALAACALPARRASRIEPLEALRTE